MWWHWTNSLSGALRGHLTPSCWKLNTARHFCWLKNYLIYSLVKLLCATGSKWQLAPWQHKWGSSTMCSAHNREILRGRFWFGCYCTCRLPRGGKVPWEGFTPCTLSAHLLLLESPRRFCHQCSADLASFTHCSLLNCNLSSLDPAFVFVSLLSQISSADFEKCHLQPIFRPAYKTPQTLPPLSSSLHSV